MSTEKDTSATSEFSCEDVVMGKSRGGAIMGIRVFRPPRPTRASEIPVMIFYPSGLPVYIPPNSYNDENIGPLLITENDHTTAAILAMSSNHTVVVPGYFMGSKHISEQLYQKKKEKVEAEAEGNRYDWFEEDYGDIDELHIGGDSAYASIGGPVEGVENPGVENQYSWSEDYGDIDVAGKAVHDMEADGSGLHIGGVWADAATSSTMEEVKDHYDFFEEDYGDIGDSLGKAAHGMEAAKSEFHNGGDSADAAASGIVADVASPGGGSGWVYPYPKHPIAGHLALKAYEFILQSLPALLNLPPDSITRGVSLSMSGSLVGAGLASSIALSEFKHPPFATGVRVETTTLVPLKKVKKQVTLNVELKSLALITPLINWCFEPLGAYDFGADQQGTGEAWLLPPVPPLSHLEGAAETEPKGGPYFLPAPTLPTLLRLRSAYFKSPEDYIDPFASPLFFMQTPGLDVGKDALAKLWVSLRQQMWFQGAIERARARRTGEKVEKPPSIDIITIEGTKRKSVWRRWPPAWGKLQIDGILETRRGGLPQKGRIRVIIPGEGEDEDGSEVIWRDENVKQPPQKRRPLDLTPATKWPSKSSAPKPPEPLSFPSTLTDPSAVTQRKKPYIIAEHAEYAQDHTPVDKYTHSPNTISLLKNSSCLLSRITSPPLSTLSAGWWLVSQAGDFVGGIERSWRSVVSADRDLRRKLELEREEKEKARLKRKREIMGSRGFLSLGRKVKKEETVVEMKWKKEVVDEEEEKEEKEEKEEVLSLLEVIGGSESMSEMGEEKLKQRMVLEKDAVVRLGKWVAEVQNLS